METATRKGLNFSPLCYLSIMSKQLSRSLDGCTVKTPSCFSYTTLHSNAKISTVSIVKRGSRNYHERSALEKKEDIAQVNDFIEARTSSVMVFSDGSVCNGSVGSGACAAVLVPLGDDVVITESKSVGQKVDPVSCEVEGILLGLQLIVDYFNRVSPRSNGECVYIFSDCALVINLLVNRNSVCVDSESIERLIRLEDVLFDMDVSVFLAWLPGHSGIQYHDFADSLAKNTAHGVKSGSIPATNTIRLADAVRISKDIAHKSWQTKWNCELSGSYTRQLIPEVGLKVHLPEERDIGISYCRLLLHDTMLMDDAHRTGLSDTPVCDCGLDKETADHFLMVCSRYDEARQQLRDLVSIILKATECSDQFTDSLLLSPANGITVKQDKQIKAALFQFFEDTHRKL